MESDLNVCFSALIPAFALFGIGTSNLFPLDTIPQESHTRLT